MAAGVLAQTLGGNVPKVLPGYLVSQRGTSQFQAEAGHGYGELEIAGGFLEGLRCGRFDGQLGQPADVPVGLLVAELYCEQFVLGVERLDALTLILERIDGSLA